MNFQAIECCHKHKQSSATLPELPSSSDNSQQAQFLQEELKRTKQSLKHAKQSIESMQEVNRAMGKQLLKIREMYIKVEMQCWQLKNQNELLSEELREVYDEGTKSHSDGAKEEEDGLGELRQERMLGRDQGSAQGVNSLAESRQSLLRVLKLAKLYSSTEEDMGTDKNLQSLSHKHGCVTDRPSEFTDPEQVPSAIADSTNRHRVSAQHPVIDSVCREREHGSGINQFIRGIVLKRVTRRLYRQSKQDSSNQKANSKVYTARSLSRPSSTLTQSQDYEQTPSTSDPVRQQNNNGVNQQNNNHRGYLHKAVISNRIKT